MFPLAFRSGKGQARRLTRYGGTRRGMPWRVPQVPRLVPSLNSSCLPHSSPNYRLPGRRSWTGHRLRSFQVVQSPGRSRCDGPRLADAGRGVEVGCVSESAYGCWRYLGWAANICGPRRDQRRMSLCPLSPGSWVRESERTPALYIASRRPLVAIPPPTTVDP